MNKKESNQGFHPIISIKSWLENLSRAVRTSGLEQLEEPSRYPVWTPEFDAELKAAITKLQKACIYAREGAEEMVAIYQNTFDPKTYGEIYHVALQRHDERARDRGDIQKSFFAEAERRRDERR